MRLILIVLSLNCGPAILVYTVGGGASRKGNVVVYLNELIDPFVDRIADTKGVDCIRLAPNKCHLARRGLLLWLSSSTIHYW